MCWKETIVNVTRIEVSIGEDLRGRFLRGWHYDFSYQQGQWQPVIIRIIINIFGIYGIGKVNGSAAVSEQALWYKHILKTGLREFCGIQLW